jgi:enoyl-CoA hydratase/carnithine racemase
MVLLGRRYPSSTLERWNVINWTVQDESLDDATMVIAQELAHGPTVAHAACKKLVAIASDQGIAAADEAMIEIQQAVFRSADFRTGVQSYREKGIGMAQFKGV